MYDRFLSSLNGGFESLSTELFSDLKPNEDALLSLKAEESLYLRFNCNQVRQNTTVEQATIELRFQADARTVTRSWNLTGNRKADLKLSRIELVSARHEARQLPPDPHQVTIANHGQSSQEFPGTWPQTENLLVEITQAAQGCDFAGLFCGGTLICANRNSNGQSHWFASRSFFLDYSIYNGGKAAKGVYAGSIWNSEAWKINFQQTHRQLTLLDLPLQKIKPGSYKTYLAPNAVSEISHILGWGALSFSAWKQRRSAFRKLADNEVTLSPLFSIRENFDLGLTPSFNDLGEVSAQHLSLIEGGKLQQLLISSRSAREYGVIGNAAAESESPRALEVATGNLTRSAILKELGRGLYLSNLHYLNWSDPASARITGMTRYACFWVEDGQAVGPIQDLRFDESLFDALGGKLQAVTDFQEISPETSTYDMRAMGGSKLPGLLINDFKFTL